MHVSSQLRSRREMLGCLAGLAGGSASLHAMPRKNSYSPHVAAQTYIWSQHFISQKKPLGEGLEEIFGATRRAGYKQVELISDFVMPELLPKTAEMLKKHELAAPIVYAGGPMYEVTLAEKTVANVLAIAERARGFGAKGINTNPSPKPRRERKSDEELTIQARFVNQAAEALHQRGMRLFVHHHDPEMAEDAREWWHLLKNTDPKKVEMCVDVDWAARGGQAPMKLLGAAGTRLGNLHLRDSRRGVWTEMLGEGDYDYSSIAAFLRELGFRGYLVVELAYEKNTQVTRSLEEDLRLSRTFVEKVFSPAGGAP